MSENSNLRGRPSSIPALVFIALFALAIPGYGAQFQLGVQIRAGFSGAGAGAWEVGAGDTSGTPSATVDATPYWANNTDRRVEIEYQRATNTLVVRLYQDATNTSAFNQANFNPTGGSQVAAGATWTLPAASFFVTAASGPNPPTSITLSNLALTSLSGALNILQPIQQTTLSASRAANGATSTVTETQDIVFQGDATGSWRLTGILNLTGIAGAAGASGNELSFGFAGTAVGAAVPEASTLLLIGMGMVALGLCHRRTNSKR
ncbi:MAG: PEP-CTERM sorting domain-containing protein [Bryobacterales bacterium]|nr:PEP-CTERM sorting domain-containing protein [Bryobacterales bacterium]